MSFPLFEKLDDSLKRKLDNCEKILKDLGSVVVAFSAGVDSTFLLAVAVLALKSENVLAVMGISPSLAESERKIGHDLADKLGAELMEIETTELDDPKYAANPAERCFYCKSELFNKLKEVAADRGLSAVVSGANADDSGDFRPGLKAGEKLGVVSPLMQAGLTKEDIRIASKEMGLETWDKPAMACLASRVPYGQPITAKKLGKIEQAEAALKQLGFIKCRVRDHGEIARIEVPASEINLVVDVKEAIVKQLQEIGYNYVTIDLEGFRSGSMNEVLSESQKDLQKNL